MSVDPSLALTTDPEKLEELGIRIRYTIQNNKGAIKQLTPEEAEARKKAHFKNTIAAIAPNLPFRDDQFDAIFDNHAAFLYFSPNTDLLEQYIRELLRILKPGGTAYVFPPDLLKELEMQLDDGSFLSQIEMFCQSKIRILSILKKLKQDNFKPFVYKKEEPFSRWGVKLTKAG